MWENLSRFILGNRLLLLFFFFVVTAFMAWEASKVQLSFSGSRVLPVTDSAYIKYNEFRGRFGEEGSVMVLGVQSPDLFKRQQFNDWLTLNNDIGDLKGIQNVLSAATLFELKKDTVNKKFFLVPLVEGPVKSDHEMDSIKQNIYNLAFYDGLIYNRVTNASLMAITFDNKVLNSPARIPVIRSIVKKSQEFSQKYNIGIHYSGLPYIRTVITQKVSHEFVLFLGLSIAVAAIILLIFFRSGYPVVFSILVVLMGVTWSLGTLSLFGYQITLLTGLIPPLIVIIGIPNSILLLNKYHTEFKKHGNKKEALSLMLKRISETTLLANLTTAIGFGVLYFTQSQLLMEFGVVASINVLATWLICLCLIPIIFSYLPDPDVRHTMHLDSKFMTNLLSKIVVLVQNRRRLIYGVTIIITLISVWGITFININGYVVDDLPEKDPIYTDMGFFEKNFDGVLPLEVSIDTKRKNGIMNLAVIKKAETLQDMITAYPEFSRAVSPVEILKFSSQAFYGGNPQFYRLPNDMEKNFILTYSANSGAKGNILKSFMDSSRQAMRVSFQVADVGSKRLTVLLDEIRPRIDSIFNPSRFDVELTGSSVIFMKGTEYLLHHLTESLVLAILLISLLRYVQFKSMRIIFISLIPNIVPLIITAGIMGFFGIPLKPSTILIFSIAFGIASDQTIYFLTRYRQELRSTNYTISKIVSDTLKETGVSMIYVALILFFGFGIFAASTFGGTVALGILLSITLFMALISNLTLLPALLLSMEKRINKKKIKASSVNKN